MQLPGNEETYSAEFRIASDPFNDCYRDAERGLVGTETLKGQRNARDGS